MVDAPCWGPRPSRLLRIVDTPRGHIPSDNVQGARLRQQSRAAPGAFGKALMIAIFRMPATAIMASCFWLPDNIQIISAHLTTEA
ncbi:hypothetical protein J6590_006226 [Homalodisca vitripennis]|nr:hypothetical protein J6590_006226 [Homalodisca vitripennis]